jgi:hypothetical protein
MFLEGDVWVLNRVVGVFDWGRLIFERKWLVWALEAFRLIWGEKVVLSLGDVFGLYVLGF